MKSILILCIILVHSLAIAQKHFMPGKIETKDGQIIEGKIYFRDKFPTPDEIEFINSKNGMSQKYAPIQLNSFEVDGRRYVSSVVEIDVTPQGLHKLYYVDSRKAIKDTLFLALLVKSSISLLYHKDREFRERFFIQNEKGEIIELIKYEYYDDVLDGDTHAYQRKLIINNKYKNQLSFYLKSCPSVAEKLDKLVLKQHVLKKLMLEYNNCAGNEIDFEQKEEKIKIQYGIVAGLVSQTLDLESNAKSFEELTTMDIKPSINLTFGASIDVVFPKNEKRWSLNNLLLYSAFDYQASVFAPTFISSIFDSVDYKISGSYIKLLTKLRYCFSSKQVRPFINIGVSGAYLLKFMSEMKREIHTYDNIRYYEAPAIKEYKKFEIGLELGAGLKMGDHFSAEFVFELSDGMSKYILLSSKMNRGYIILNYTF